SNSGIKNDIDANDVIAMDLLGWTPTTSRANLDVYTGTTGTWSTGSKWTQAQFPLPGDVATLSPASGAVVVTYNLSAGFPAQLTLNATGGASVTLNMAASNLLAVAANEIVGQTGTGVVTQSAGTHTIGGALHVGFAAGSSGTFT